MSVFSSPRGLSEEDEMQMPDMDESKMEQALSLLSREAEHMDENDPRQAANLMRKLSDMTGLNLGENAEELLKRMEAGEDPEQLEAEMGDLFEGEDPFSQKKKASRGMRAGLPRVDKELYDL